MIDIKLLDIILLDINKFMTSQARHDSCTYLVCNQSVPLML